MTQPVLKPTPSVFETASHLVAIAEYAKAEPLLIQILLREDQDYTPSLLLLAKVYDQRSSPEKAILNARDFLNRTKVDSDVFKAQGLLIKNQAKLKLSISQSEEKMKMQELIHFGSISHKLILEDLRWTLDFLCDQYCLSEIEYLKEVQLFVLYLIEKDPTLYRRGFDVLTSRYDFFETYLEKTDLKINERKKIASALFLALQKLKSYHLQNGTLGSLKTGELIIYLNQHLKRIERFLYDK